MKMKSLLGIMLSLSILQSCQNDETGIIQNEVNKQGITFSSIIDDAPNSRAYDTSWEKNDVIGLFMYASNAKTNLLATNIPYVTSNGDGYFVSQHTPLQYPEDNTPVDFIAYYPYNENISDYNSYSIDLSDQTQQSALDLMTAVNLTNRNQTLPQGNLQFKHLLAKLVLNLKSTSGNSLKGIKASISGLQVKGTANLGEGTITPSGEATTFSLYIDEEATKAEAILLPQALTGNLKIKLELNGQSKEITTQIAGSIEQGNKYICNVNISSKGGEITTDPQAKYIRWAETPLITESQLAQSNIKYITHYTGETYTNSTHSGIKIRNYSMLYDTNLKMAYWVAYPLCSWYLGETGRTDAWDYDPELTESLQPNLGKGINGYDRGHQIPSGDRTRSRSINEQTFYYTNMTPQIGSKMNQTIWADLEKAVRGWSSATDTLYVITGAMPTTTTDKTIKYVQDNSGKNMAVPKYYFKVLARKVSGQYQTVGYKLDNTSYSDRNYNIGLVSVKELEEMTGFTFFPDVPEITESVKSQKTAW
ncbi:fimbrillin family protein [Bacteroides mediterraneensis]|uniref:Fimbrillin family protein n=1 Tax=Bacteroides mediterraneensis TaxID=1841856 RepID=A0ABS2EYI8_9BACE|nr:fimbrillin family protein [Bacteroides mediterraneensis]MBM6759736.1 fimbrillin family protein [Bacteroides mediterraneensis]